MGKKIFKILRSKILFILTYDWILKILDPGQKIPDLCLGHNKLSMSYVMEQDHDQ